MFQQPFLVELSEFPHGLNNVGRTTCFPSFPENFLSSFSKCPPAPEIATLAKVNKPMFCLICPSLHIDNTRDRERQFAECPRCSGQPCHQRAIEIFKDILFGHQCIECPTVSFFTIRLQLANPLLCPLAVFYLLLEGLQSPAGVAQLFDICVFRLHFPEGARRTRAGRTGRWRALRQMRECVS